MFSFVIRAVGIETACESLCLERSSTVPLPISFPSKLQLDQLIQVEGFVCFYFLNTASESSIKPPCFPSKILFSLSLEPKRWNKNFRFRLSGLRFLSTCLNFRKWQKNWPLRQTLKQCHAFVNYTVDSCYPFNPQDLNANFPL